MASPEAIRTKIDKALTKIGALKQVFVRTYTITGDELLGYEKATEVDTLLDPQPIYKELGEDLVLSDGKVIPAGAYRFLVSGNSITLADVKNPKLRIVLKNDDGSEVEVFQLMHYTTPNYQRQVLAFVLFGVQVAR